MGVNVCVCVPNSINVSGNLVVRTLLVGRDDSCGGQTCLPLLEVWETEEGTRLRTSLKGSGEGGR